VSNHSVERSGLVTVLWGDGKGKTSAAAGMALRALGHGMKVHLVPFLKGTLEAPFGLSGELKALRDIPHFTMSDCVWGGWVDGSPTASQQESVRQAVEEARRVLARGDHDMVILDEILYAVSFGALPVEAVLDLLSLRRAETDLVLTGGWNAIPEVNRVADVVTEMKKHKHPFDRGGAARAGFEY